MKAEADNLRFSYMYRDVGNYKEYGEIIFSNPSRLSAEAAREKLRARLIDGEYFFPREWGVPLICGESWMDNWYEILDFTLTDEEPTDARTVDEFLHVCEKRIGI